MHAKVFAATILGFAATLIVAAPAANPEAVAALRARDEIVADLEKRTGGQAPALCVLACAALAPEAFPPCFIACMVSGEPGEPVDPTAPDAPTPSAS